MITRMITTMLVVFSLAVPSAQAHKAHHRRHHAHSASIGVDNPNAPADEKTWAEWRVDMADTGFTPAETEALEVSPADEASE